MGATSGLTPTVVFTAFSRPVAYGYGTEIGEALCAIRRVKDFTFFFLSS